MTGLTVFCRLITKFFVLHKTDVFLISARLFHFMPEYSIPYAIHLLAHDPDLQSHEHLEILKNIKE